MQMGSQVPSTLALSHRSRVLIAALAALLTVACSGGSTTLAGPSADKCQISVTAFTRTFDARGGAGTVTLATARECAWSAATTTSWISFPARPAGQGEGSFRFAVGAHAGVRPREGAIDVAGQRLAITQGGAPCRFDLDETITRVPASGGRGSVRVTTLDGCAWTAESLVTWVRVTGGERGDATGLVSFTVVPNGGAGRTGTLSIAGLTHRVEQAAAASPGAPPPPPEPPPPAPPPPSPPPPPPPPEPPSCEYRLSPGSAKVAAAGGVITVSLTTGSTCAWSASDDAGWVRVEPPTSGTGSGGIRVRVDPNTDPAARQATVRVASASLELMQAGAPAPPPCTATVSPTSGRVAAGGGELQVQLDTGGACTWTATTSQSWLTASPGAGAGRATLTLTAAPHTGPEARQATATIAGETVSVTQEAAEPPSPVRIAGKVQNLSGHCPTVRFKVRADAVVTTAATVYGPDPPGTACGNLRNGREVVVTGVRQGGAISATLIVFETNGPKP